MAVDMDALKIDNPEAHAYILTLRNEAAANRIEGNEWKAKYTTAQGTLSSVETERDTLAQKASKLETDAKTSQVDAWRSAAALKHGLTDAQAKRLQGNTSDEFLADAESFAKEVGPVKKAAPVDPSLNTPDPVGDGSGVNAESREFGQKLLGLMNQTV